MINAELRPTNNRLEMRYSNPNGEFAGNEFFPVYSEEEARRMLHFKNRQYITGTLISWLYQRKHAMPFAHDEIFMMISWVENIQKCGLGYIRSVIRKRTPELKSIAPLEKSRCNKYYQSTIIPILEFCQLQN